MSAVDGHDVSLTDALFPDQNFAIPHNKLLNMTYDCTTKQLSVHVEVNKEIEIFAQVLSLKKAILSIHLSIYPDSKPAYTAVLSGDTLLFSLPTFVAVRYNLTTKELIFKGVPTEENSMHVQNVFEQVSETSLYIPNAFNTISDITFLGKKENGITNIAMKGNSNHTTVVILLQIRNNTAAAFMADIRGINLASFVDTALGMDISNIPLFGTLTIPKLGFSSATGEIRSSLLPLFVVPSSPLAAFGTTIPKGISAYFTAKIGEISTSGILSRNKLLFKVPPATPLSIKVLLAQYSRMNILSSVPLVKTQILNSVISSMAFDPQNKHFVVKSSLPVLALIPGIMKLTTVDVVLNGSIGRDPSITELSFIGFWKIGSLNVHTLVTYNKSSDHFHIIATLEEARSLNIEVLMKKVAGLNLPRALASFSPSSIVGNVYSNANYFLAMKGKNTGETIYLLFLKDSNGSKVGITASIMDMRLSDLAESAVGTDVTEIPYFGSLVIPSVMISITSDVIKSPALPHLLGNESALLLDGGFLPAGVTASFNLNIDGIRGIIGTFADGVVTLTVPNSADFTMQTLSSVIPGISDAIQALPSEVTSILRSKVHSFAFNVTNNGINIVASMHRSRFINSFVSLSDLRLVFEGSIGTIFSTNSLELTGNWNIDGNNVLTSVVYDGINEEFSLFVDSNGEEFNINDVVESFLAKSIPLPSNLSFFVLTGISGRIVNGNTTVVMNGVLKEGKISVVLQKSSLETAGAIVVNISHFQLAEFIQLATGIDITMIPFFGTMEIPQLRFAIATNNISKQTVREFTTSGSPLKRFRSGIIEGISGQFLMQIGNVSRIGVKLLHKIMTFKVPGISTLSMNALLSTMPSIRDTLNNIPSELSSYIGSARVKMFSFDPSSNEIVFEGSLDGEVHIVPKFLSLRSVKLSLSMTLSPQKHIKSLDFCGFWTLENIPINMKVTYTGNEGRLDMAGEIERVNSQIDTEDLLTSLSKKTLPIPPMLSSVTLTRLSGNKRGNVTFIALSGSVGEGHIFVFYQKSSSQSGIGIAADTRNFRLSSLVSSAEGVDISSIPFFGTLEIPRIGVTVASKYISNPLLSAIYPQASPLTNFGDAISRGVTATFVIDIGEARGVIANYIRGELDLHIPDTVELHLSRVLQLLPNLENAISSLPQIIQDISSMTVSELLYVPIKEELQVNGNLDTLTIIPDFLTLQQSEYTLRGMIGRKSAITYASFKGKWLFSSLSLIAEVVYDNDMFLIDAYPEGNETLSLEEFVRNMAQETFKIPSVFDAVEFTQVIGKLEDDTLSIIFIGEVGTIANIGIVYEVSQNSKVLVFAADVQQFKLSDLIEIGTGIDISGVPLFGALTIPALHLSISSNSFSTINLPDLNISGVPKELFLEAIPQGIKGQFLASIGTAVRVHGEFYDDMLTLSFDSSSLSDFLSTFSDMRSSIESLPSAMRSVVNAKINELVYVPTTRSLLVSLSMNTITIVPGIISIKEVSLSINTSMVGNRLQTQEINLQSRPYHYNTVSFRKEYAKEQTVSIDTLTMEGKWSIRDIEINTNIEYNALSRRFIIQGAPNGPGNLNLDDLINAFSPTNLRLPQVLSSIELENINVVSTDTETTIIVTATAGRASVYLVFQKTIDGSAIAVAAEMHQFTLVDLVRTATGIDLSPVPFIGSFTVASMAFTVSNNPIKTSLLESTFASDSALQAYSDGIPNGLTAYFKVLIGECFENEVTYANKTLEFTVPSKCSLALRTLLSEIPSVNSVVKALPPPISDLLSSNLKFIHYDLTLRKLSIETTLNELTIISGVLQLQNIKISVVIIFGSGTSAGLQSLKFHGDWILQGITVQIMMSYNQRSQELLFEALPKQGLTISHVISGFTQTNIQFPSFLESVKLTNVIGRKASNKYTFIVSGSTSNINVYVVYHYIEGATPHIAVAAEVRSFVLADVIDGFEGIPYFGTLRVPNLGICAARGAITTSLLTTSFARSTTLKMYNNTLPNGFSVKVNLPLDDSNTLVGSYANKVLSFIPANGDVSLSSLLNQISDIDISSIGGVFGDILEVGMKNVTFDVENKELYIEMFLKKLPLFEKLLQIRDIHLLLKTKFSGSGETIAEAKGIVDFGKRGYTISIQRNPSTKKYFLSLNTDSLSIFGVISAVGAAFLPEDLQVLLGQIFDINILNATIAYPFGADPQHVLISGTPQLFGLPTVHVSAVIIKVNEATELIQKYSLGRINFVNFIKKLMGVSLPFKILDQDTDISLLISPMSMEGSLSVPGFSDIDIHQGLSISTSLGWPSGCSDDIFCAVMKILLGGGKLHFQGTITNARYFTITASVRDVSLGGGVVLKRAGLQFVGGVEPSTGLVGSIKLKKPPVTLNAGIKLTISGVRLEGSMSGCWDKAFGSPYITICNLYLGMTLLPVAPPITGLEFGGRLEIGKKTCDKVYAEVYVGINVIDPNQNFFYADIGPLTFQKFFDALCIGISLPKPLGDSGFPKGLKTSFSLLGKELPHAGISIPVGFRFKGTINILGLEASVDINISSTRFKVRAELPRMNIIGLFKMYKSSRDKSKGPLLAVDIGNSSVPGIEVSGYVEVLGISLEARLLISSTKYEVFLEGKFLKLWQVRLNISATYTKSISDGNFMAEGYFQADLFDKIAKGIRDALNKAADEADKHISAAQDKIREAQAKLDSANNKLEDAKRKVDDAKRVFDVAVGKMEAAQRKLDGVCRIRTCSSSEDLQLSVNTKRGYACYDCCMLSSPAFVCMHAAL